MLVALHLVFGQSHDCVICSIGWFLELSELDAFIASSFRSQHKVASQVEPVSNFLILEAYELSQATHLIEREDGTTAAERFFAIKPRDLFGRLLEQLPMPSRPRKRRTQPDLI